MEFEIIDESEVEFTYTERVKKTPSLFDSALEDRTYWGNDPGTELSMSMARIQIRKYIKNLKLMDVDDHDLSRRLLKPYRDELRMYQLEMLSILLANSIYTIAQAEYGEMNIVIVEPYNPDLEKEEEN